MIADPPVYSAHDLARGRFRRFAVCSPGQLELAREVLPAVVLEVDLPALPTEVVRSPEPVRCRELGRCDGRRMSSTKRNAWAAVKRRVISRVVIMSNRGASMGI